MTTEFDDSEHWGFFLTNQKLTSETGKYVRMSSLVLAALRAAGVFSTMEDGTTAPATDKLWLDKNSDPAVLKEWDATGSSWVPISFDRLFGRAIVTALASPTGTADALVVSAPSPFMNNRLYSLTPAANNTGAATIQVVGVGTYPVTYSDGSALDAGELRQGRSTVLLFTGGAFHVPFQVAGIYGARDEAEDAATLAEAWAEGTEPAGVNTKSSKEWALVAQGAVTYNRISVRGTIDAGVGPYDVGVLIGSANNIDIKVGGVIFDHDLYTISGTTFSFLSDPGADQPWEAVVQTEVRQLGAVSDGTVDRVTLDASFSKSVPISAQEYGAVFDGTSEDQAKIKAAAMAAVAAGVPFVVPNRGFNWASTPSAPNEGLVIQVPEDFPTIQAAHDAMLNWIFPATPPKFGDTTQNHILPVSVTISVSGEKHTQDGVNITWNHPHGDQIRVKGRDRTSLTLASQQALTFSSGVQLLRLRFSTWPAVDPIVGGTLRILNPGGSGAYQNFEGAWRITAVDPVNKDITIAVWLRTDASAVTSIISSGTFYYIPTLIRFINQPDSGADVGGFDVHTTLRISDVALSGDSSGTNASTTNGVVAREGARVHFDQFCAVTEFQRSGLWLLNGAYAQVGYAAFCGNNSGINNLQSTVDGSRTAIQGNATYNYIGGIGSRGSIVLAAFGGAGTAGILVNGNASLICSGHSRRSPYGVLCWPGGFVNINDMNVRANTTFDVRRHGGGRIMLTSNDAGTFSPALDTGDSYGGFTALSATLAAVA